MTASQERRKATQYHPHHPLGWCLHGPDRCLMLHLAFFSAAPSCYIGKFNKKRRAERSFWKLTQSGQSLFVALLLQSTSTTIAISCSITYTLDSEVNHTSHRSSSATYSGAIDDDKRLRIAICLAFTLAGQPPSSLDSNHTSLPPIASAYSPLRLHHDQSCCHTRHRGDLAFLPRRLRHRTNRRPHPLILNSRNQAQVLGAQAEPSAQP